MPSLGSRQGLWRRAEHAHLYRELWGREAPWSSAVTSGGPLHPFGSPSSCLLCGMT